MKLNVLIICKTMPWQFKGGIQTHSWELAKAMQRLGHDITILSGGSFRSKTTEAVQEGIKVVNLPYFPGRYIKPISFAAEEISFNLMAKKWVKANHRAFDIIHAQGRSGYLLFTINEIRSKLLSTVHGLVELENQSAKWYNLNRLIHKVLAKAFEKRLMKASQLNISVSQTLKKDIEELRTDSKTVTVIPNGVSLKKQTTIKTLRNSRFLFVGRLHPVKGIAPIVEHIANANSEISLDIIGNGSEKEKIEQVIKQNNLQNRVRLLGEKTNAEVHELIPNYRALILPSQYETQGIVLLEANAHAIPVIASDIPAIRETVENGRNGLLCNPDNPIEFITAMEFMAHNDQAAFDMGKLGQQLVSASYSWDMIAERTVSAYYKIAQ